MEEEIGTASASLLEEFLQAKSVLILLRSGERQFKCKRPSKRPRGSERKRSMCAKEAIWHSQVFSNTASIKTSPREKLITKFPALLLTQTTLACIWAKTPVPTPACASKCSSICGLGLAQPALQLFLSSSVCFRKRIYRAVLSERGFHRHCSLKVHWMPCCSPAKAHTCIPKKSAGTLLLGKAIHTWSSLVKMQS